MSKQSDATWTPLDAAAATLGISPDAARKRLERGTLVGEKRAGRWYVRLDGQDAASTDAGRHATGQADAIRTPPDAVSDTARELIDHLKSENDYLREQLDHSRRELSSERERFDTIHQMALLRIEALTAGDDESAQHPRTAPTAPPGREEPPQMTPDTSHEPSHVAAWLRRLLGRS